MADQPEPKLLLELRTDECKFPVAERNGQHLFCGRRRFDATTYYCATHLRRMYAEKQPRAMAVPALR